MPKRSHGFRAQHNATRQKWKARKARLNTSNSNDSSRRPSCDKRDASLPKKHKQRDETSMICAMEAELKVNQAAKEFDMPPTT